ncbi:PilX N-terminal domain-containing pilus assembly protein [Uliginosibacterium sp. 31-16]|uniref:pilus assembly PilX family protein n=1 Tax=Uliginosibacterium sp. 31-16 TaxID=3068315 RepID=UPI00273F16B8|nr:PilX N-terminal domain-containing pilus assembly protein [Uliginosibacterium sp. 31-16]MDP5240137.1 PilX N-terminal domain-containing pilus assembly protein [Uliginosibacterium sp. 31-16]
MNIIQTHTPLYQRKERGAALLVGLIVLLLLTMLGITAMRTSTLEERMAGNMRDSNIAFQSAEGALREAFKTDLAGKAYDGSATGYNQQITTFTDGSGNNISEFKFWSESFDWTTAALTATKANGVTSAPKYVVETIPATTGVWKAGERAKRAYRVTAISSGASNRSETIVQGTIVQED